MVRKEAPQFKWVSMVDMKAAKKAVINNPFNHMPKYSLMIMG